MEHRTWQNILNNHSHYLSNKLLVAFAPYFFFFFFFFCMSIKKKTTKTEDVTYLLSSILESIIDLFWHLNLCSWDRCHNAIKSNRFELSYFKSCTSPAIHNVLHYKLYKGRLRKIRLTSFIIGIAFPEWINSTKKKKKKKKKHLGKVLNLECYQISLVFFSFNLPCRRDCRIHWLYSLLYRKTPLPQKWASCIWRQTTSDGEAQF